MTFPAVTRSRWEMRTWGGTFNSPMTFRVEKLFGSGPSTVSLCLSNTSACYWGMSGATTSVSVPTGPGAPQYGGNQIGLKFDLPPLATAVDATYLVELVSTADPSQKASWTIRVRR